MIKDKDESQNQLNKKIYDLKTKQTILVSNSDAVKLNFLMYRLFFVLAFAIVVYSVFKNLDFKILALSTIAVFVLLEVTNRKFRKNMKFTKVEEETSYKINNTKQYLYFRSVVYFLIAVMLVVFLYFRNQQSFETTDLFIVFIVFLALSNTVTSLKKIRQQRDEDN
jgi:membrane protein YdbS with pleckstrin-like domain